MNRTILYRWIGINAILISGLIHLYHAPADYKDAPYIANLFYIYFCGAIISIIGIAWGGHLWGWVFGGFLAAGAIVDYLISRTAGLPGVGIENWRPPLAYFSIGLELLFFLPFFASYSPQLKRAK